MLEAKKGITSRLFFGSQRATSLLSGDGEEGNRTVKIQKNPKPPKIGVSQKECKRNAVVCTQLRLLHSFFSTIPLSSAFGLPTRLFAVLTRKTRDPSTTGRKAIPCAQLRHQHLRKRNLRRLPTRSTCTFRQNVELLLPSAASTPTLLRQSSALGTIWGCNQRL